MKILKTKWKAIIFNAQNIKVETSKAVLIKLPGTEKCFWHPKSLIKDVGGKGYFLSFSYTDVWKFKVDNKVVPIEYIENAFAKGNESFKIAIDRTKPYNLIHTPKKLELESDITIPEVLKDD